MTPGARESDALLVAMYEGEVPPMSPITARLVLRASLSQDVQRIMRGADPKCVSQADEWATDLGFGALVTGDYGEVDR